MYSDECTVGAVYVLYGEWFINDWYLSIKVWRRGAQLLWTCPHWLLEAALNLVRWYHFRSDYIRQSANGSVPLQVVTTWCKILLACFLLLVDAFTALQVTNHFKYFKTSYLFRSVAGESAIIICSSWRNLTFREKYQNVPCEYFFKQLANQYMNILSYLSWLIPGKFCS